MRGITVAMSLALGCGAYAGRGPADVEPARVPGQERAVSAVLAVYGPPELGPPWVRWRAGEGLDCGDGLAWRLADGRCVDGLFDPRFPGEVEVARPAGVPLAESSLAHELAHWFLFQTGRDDPWHRRPGWWERSPDGRVWRAEAALLALPGP